jgi:Uma2 family endonuclease
MIQTLAKTENQYLVKRAVTWKQFKTLQSAFDEIGGVRMVYCEGELEIVVVTSGGVKKLKKYQLRGIPEVWLWENGKISIYRLVDGEYAKRDRSEWLPELDIEHLEQCLLIESQLDSILAFQRKYQVN